jgi:hypothetical protein
MAAIPQIQPSYSPGDYVTILALERKGRVILIRFDGHQIEYFVGWWDEGKRCSEWLFVDEIGAPK